MSLNPDMILKIHKNIVSKGGIVPKNKSWIMLIPGDYILSNDTDDTSISIKPTLLDLLKAGLLMTVYYHPYKKDNLLILCSLQPKFILAEKVKTDDIDPDVFFKDNVYILKTDDIDQQFSTRLDEMELESLSNYTIS